MPESDPGPILVVDDDPAILSAVAEVLRTEGYEVETALNGARALDVVDASNPSLVLLGRSRVSFENGASGCQRSS